MVRLVEPDGTPNLVVTKEFAVSFCAHNPGWSWEEFWDT